MVAEMFLHRVAAMSFFAFFCQNWLENCQATFMKEVFKQQAQSTKEVAVIGPVVAVEIGVMKSINHFAQNPPYFCFYFIVINRNAMARLLRKESNK